MRKKLTMLVIYTPTVRRNLRLLYDRGIRYINYGSKVYGIKVLLANPELIGKKIRLVEMEKTDEMTANNTEHWTNIYLERVIQKSDPIGERKENIKPPTILSGGRMPTLIGSQP